MDPLEIHKATQPAFSVGPSSVKRHLNGPMVASFLTGYMFLQILDLDHHWRNFLNLHMLTQNFGGALNEMVQMSHAMWKCGFGISDQVRFKPAFSATQTSYIIGILDLARVGILLSRQRTKRCWSDCSDAQADLRLYCSHMSLSRFLHAVATLKPRIF